MLKLEQKWGSILEVRESLAGQEGLSLEPYGSLLVAGAPTGSVVRPRPGRWGEEAVPAPGS